MTMGTSRWMTSMCRMEPALSQVGARAMAAAWPGWGLRHPMGTCGCGDRDSPSHPPPPI